MLRDIAIIAGLAMVVAYFSLSEKYAATVEPGIGISPLSREESKQRTPLELSKALEVDARQSFEAENANRTDLQQERKRSADLADRLADAKRSAAAQVANSQQRIDRETARAASLDRELLGLREQLAEAVRDVMARDDERRAFAAEKADLEDKLQEEKERAKDLADKLTEAQRDAAAQIEVLRKQIASTHAAAHTDTHVAETPPTVAPPAASPPQGIEASDLPPRTPPAAARSAAVALPKDVPARLVLRYALHNELARARAMDISLTLRKRGFDVVEPVGSSAVAATNNVTFFYDEDRSNAKQIANVLAAPGPVRGRLSKDDPWPRPGTIEVSING